MVRVRFRVRVSVRVRFGSRYIGLRLWLELTSTVTLDHKPQNDIVEGHRTSLTVYIPQKRHSLAKAPGMSTVGNMKIG